MSEIGPGVSPSNPFNATMIAPGSQDYFLGAGQSWTSLSQRFAEQQRRAAVVGPHGSGKTTFLLTFARRFIDPALRPLQWRWFRVRSSRLQFRLEIGTAKTPEEPPLGMLREVEQVTRRQLLQSLDRNVITVVDGYDAWPAWWRWRLRRLALRRGAGLLVTSHHPERLPTLLERSPELSDLRQLVSNWRPQTAGLEIESLPLAEIWQRHPGNLRECLFELYDWWRDHRPTSTASQF